MKRVVLISVLSLLEAQLKGFPSIKIHTSTLDDLYVVPKSTPCPNLNQAVGWKNNKPIYIASPSRNTNSCNTNILEPQSPILAEESRLRIVTQHLFPNRKRSHKYKPVTFKPNSFLVKVPP